jgi:hypothetical protein
MLQISDASTIDISWGISRLFGTCDIGHSGIGRGWSEPEPSHIWNDGPDATLTLLLPGGPCHARLSVDGLPFIRPGQPVQDMTLYVNGFRLGFWRLVSSTVSTVSAAIAPEHMFVRREGCFLECTFHIPTCCRPMDLGEGSDRRQLGFCFQTLVVTNTARFDGKF